MSYIFLFALFSRGVVNILNTVESSNVESVLMSNVRSQTVCVRVSAHCATKQSGYFEMSICCYFCVAFFVIQSCSQVVVVLCCDCELSYHIVVIFMHVGR